MKLKNWVTNTLIIISMIALIFLSADCEDIKLFVTSKIICSLILILNYYLISRYIDEDYLEEFSSLLLEN